MKIKISNNWLFIDNYKPSYLKEFPKDCAKIDLPHTVKEVPYNYFSELDYQFLSTYKKEIEIDEVNKEERYFLKFDGVMLKAHIYFNNHDFGVFISGYLPFQIEITDYIKKGQNKLLVICDSREDKTIPPFGFVVDYLTFGGIYRDVFLITEPKKFISNLYASGDQYGDLKILYDLSENVSKNYRLSYELYFEDELVEKFNNNQIKISNPKLWDTKTPNLYVLKAILEDENVVDEETVRFGFRTAEFTAKGFYLNGKALKLIGLNRHQAFPYVGYAMPKTAQEDDAYLLKKEIGVNLVRCSHYPPSDYFLNKCDELGLLVFDEIPGWQYVGHDEEWRNNFYDFTSRMIYKDRRFTSVIAYGVRIDESKDDHELYSKANEIAHSLDPYRQTTGVRNFKTSELLEDIYAYNDFSCNRNDHGLDNPKSVKTKGKPYIVTECMGHMHPIKPFDTYLWRLETTLRYAKIIDDTFKYNSILGVIGWCAFDYNTHKDFGSGDRICYHGVYDIFRNEKMPSSIFKSQQEDYDYLEILNPLTQGDVPAAETGYLYVATNADYVDLYRGKDFINHFYPDFKDYPNTPHPLIKIDDFIGERFKENVSKKDAIKLKRALNYAATEGYQNLSLKIKLSILSVVLHEKLKFDDLYNLYTKYVQAWGESLSNYTVVAFKDGKEVNRKTIGPATSWHLEASSRTPIIYLDEGYEVTRVSIKLLDQFNNQALYSFAKINLKVTGPLSVIGPSNLSLIGGDISIYIKASKVGKGNLEISSDYGNIVIPLIVKNAK
jgi:Beta-galactosidase/beta-glucuronidase